jgi:hypothetical protein
VGRIRGRRRWVGGCALVAALVAVAIAGTAMAGVRPHRAIAAQTSVLGPPPAWAVVNPCLPVIALPHAVGVGKPVTAHAGPENADAPGCSSVKGQSWRWTFHGVAVPGCAVNATKCVLRSPTPTAEWEPFCAVGTTGGLTSCDYVEILPKGLFDLSGTVSSAADPSQAAGVTVHASGPGGGQTTLTDSHGNYAFAEKSGRYTVTVRPGGGAGTKVTPPSRTVSVHADLTGVDFRLGADVDHVSVTVSPAGVPASGTGMADITITDRDGQGVPVAGKVVKIEPPIEYQAPGLVCDDSARLVYPSRLSDGTLLGSSFTRVTDGAGQIHLRAFLGTVAGAWAINAGEPDEPRSDWGSDTLTIAAHGGAGSLTPELPALLVAASDSTLADFHHAGIDNVLTWLGALSTGPNAGVLNGVAFLPIWARDASGTVNVGVVLYADSPAVRQSLMNYLTGASATPPPEEQAVVIDVAKMQELLFGTRLAGHEVNTVGYRLPSLQEWQSGGVIDVGENAKGQPRHLPIPARGVPHFGFAVPQGNEGLEYGFGPYPPFGAGPAAQAAFNKCVAYTFATSVTPHSPISVVVHGHHGTAVGVPVKGAPVDTLPGATLTYHGRRTLSILAPPGGYSVQVTGIGSGPATLVLDEGGRGTIASRVFTFRVARGRHGTIAPGARTMRFGHRVIHATAGLPLRVRGLPSRLRRGHRTSLRLRVKDQFGTAAGGVTVAVSGPGIGHLTATTAAGGTVSVTVDPRRRGVVKLVLSGPGYARTVQRIRVR